MVTASPLSVVASFKPSFHLPILQLTGAHKGCSVVVDPRSFVVGNCHPTSSSASSRSNGDTAGGSASPSATKSGSSSTAESSTAGKPVAAVLLVRLSRCCRCCRCCRLDRLRRISRRWHGGAFNNGGHPSAVLIMKRRPVYQVSLDARRSGRPSGNPTYDGRPTECSLTRDTHRVLDDRRSISLSSL